MRAIGGSLRSIPLEIQLSNAKSRPQKCFANQLGSVIKRFTPQFCQFIALPRQPITLKRKVTSLQHST